MIENFKSIHITLLFVCTAFAQSVGHRIPLESLCDPECVDSARATLKDLDSPLGAIIRNASYDLPRHRYLTDEYIRAHYFAYGPDEWMAFNSIIYVNLKCVLGATGRGMEIFMRDRIESQLMLHPYNERGVNTYSILMHAREL